MTEIPFKTRMRKAILWFRASQREIEAALPLDFPGGTYLPERKGPNGRVLVSATEVIDGSIRLWNQGLLSDRLARAYVLQPLRNLYKAMEERSNADNESQNNDHKA
ncbi:MAG: hypothetical protein ACFB0C_15535 [Leptolyngbyaceae cyanobacterium]